MKRMAAPENIADRLLEAHVASLIGQSTRSARFLREVRRVSAAVEGRER